MTTRPFLKIISKCILTVSGSIYSLPSLNTALPTLLFSFITISDLTPKNYLHYFKIGTRSHTQRTRSKMQKRASSEFSNFSEFRLRERPTFANPQSTRKSDGSITKSVLDGKTTKKWTPSWLDEAQRLMSHDRVRVRPNWTCVVNNHSWFTSTSFDQYRLAINIRPIWAPFLSPSELLKLC